MQSESSATTCTPISIAIPLPGCRPEYKQKTVVRDVEPCAIDRVYNTNFELVVIRFVTNQKT